MARITQTTDIVEVDQNGEILKQTSTKTTNWGVEPDYIKLYLQDVLYLSDIPTQYSAALMSLLKRVSFAGDDHGMCIVLAPMIRDDICKELGLKNRQSLSNILTKLVQGEILYTLGRNVYRLNPYLFGRGTWADIAKIRMQVTYTSDKNRTFKTTIEKKKSDAADIAKAFGKTEYKDDDTTDDKLDGQMTWDDREFAEYGDNG